MAPQAAYSDNGVTRRGGFTLVELLTVLTIIGTLIGILLGAVQRVRAASVRVDCQNRMRQVGLALQQHHDAHRVLPPGLRTKDDPYLFMSWNTRLLPYLEQQAVWDVTVEQFKLHPLFYSPPGSHSNVSARPMLAFVCPAGDRSTGMAKYLYPEPAEYVWGFTWYLGVIGPNDGVRGGVLYANSRVRLVDVTDGTSNTVAVGERPPSPDNHFGWWYAGLGQDGTGGADMVLGVAEYRRGFRLPTCELGPHHFRPGRLDEMCDVLHFWSLHPGGANFAFADGSVRFLSYSADSILPALATRTGGEVVSVD